MTARRGIPEAGARYRVEYRAGQGTLPERMGELPQGAPVHHQSLGPWLAHLLLAGRTRGEVRLIDRATGAVVARRRVGPNPASRRGNAP